MDEVSYQFESEQQFWLDQYLQTEYDVARCNYRLLSSNLFAEHGDYIRQQIIYGLLQDDAPDILHFIASFLLFDGRENEKCFEMMNNEGTFPRILDLIMSVHGVEEPGLHRLLMELLYEMSRIQRIKLQDLMLVEDDFVRQLFEIIEELSDDVNDPYHYPVIRVLLVLNEQFMVSAHEPNQSNPPSAPLTNRVMKVLSSEGGKYRTFGENIILLLNRESETSLQLLTLKLMYLLFTTPSTQEYFYTNDLRVLVDILIRNLLDLPEDATALRHTYLRVLYPLLCHTQLRHPPHYKRAEIKNLLAVLVRGQGSDFKGENSPTAVTDDTEARMRYFEDVDETTIRLVSRCGRVSWLKDPRLLRTIDPPKLNTETLVTIKPTLGRQNSSPTSITTTDSPTLNTPPIPPLPRKIHKRGSSKTSIESIFLNTATPQLGMDLDSARTSSLSVLEVAAQQEKPGVITPSRKSNGIPPTQAKREKPEPPKARRSGWIGRKKAPSAPEEEAAESHEAVPSIAVPTKDHRQQQQNEASRLDEADSSISLSVSNQPPPPLPRKPPPAPKTRRWRLNRRPEPSEDAPSPAPSTRRLNPDYPPVLSGKIPSPPPVPVPGPLQPKESISTALEQAQAEAVEDVAARMEGVKLSPYPITIEAGGSSREGGGVAAVVKGLAPPNVAPRRGVMGPMFEVIGSERGKERERSPFQDDEDEEEAEHEAAESELERKEVEPV